MTKEQARKSLIESGIFGREFVPIWDEKYAQGDGPLEERIQQAVADTIYVLVDRHLLDEEVACEMYEITVITHGFVEYTGYIME
jgi:hypothetical protein